MAPNPHSTMHGGDVCVDDSFVLDVSTTRNVGSRITPKKEHAVIFFDWDDTLMASTAIARLGLCPKYIHEKPIIPEAIQGELAQLEKTVVQLLEKALTFGRVIIVTAAEAGWVELSASLFMPGVLPLLHTQIKVVSARSTYEYLYPDCPRRWKIEAFNHELFPVWEDLALAMGYNYDSDNQQYDRCAMLPNHVISFGDGPTEREALINVKMLAMGACHGKSMKFITYPKISELKMELDLILENMEYLCTHKGDLDLQITWEMLNMS